VKKADYTESGSLLVTYAAHYRDTGEVEDAQVASDFPDPARGCPDWLACLAAWRATPCSVTNLRAG
jgi:hypothetical protein